MEDLYGSALLYNLSRLAIDAGSKSNTTRLDDILESQDYPEYFMIACRIGDIVPTTISQIDSSLISQQVSVNGPQR